MLSKNRIKYIQSLGHKKFRDQYGSFIVEGSKMAAELIQEFPGNVKSVWAMESWKKEHEEILQNIDLDKIEVISETELGRISSLKTPNMVLIEVEKNKANENPDLNSGISIILDNIQDPGNLGTIIRIADWFGVNNIICSPDTADMYNPKVVQATMGSILRVNVCYINLMDFLKQHSGIPVFAAVIDGRNIHEINAPQYGIIAIGNESKGLSEEILGLATQKITIPKHGKAESLNAGIATAIILSHFIK